MLLGTTVLELRTDAELGWVVTVDHGPDGTSDDPELPARGVESLLTRFDHLAARHRHAILRQNGLSLVLVNFHVV